MTRSPISRVAVCICTYNRPAGLRALLRAMEAQRLDFEDHLVEIVVVDNSQTKSAFEICVHHRQTSRFKLSVVSEQRKGLTFARNAALAAALETGASHLAFIDDDELPEPSWLKNIIATLQASGCAAAVGPVVALFETLPEPWLPLEAYDLKREPANGFVDDAYTCNTAIDLSVIAKCGLRFDQRFNEIGSEDTFFFNQLRGFGYNIAWAETAVVYAVIPLHRMSAAWLWQRWYRTGNTAAYIAQAVSEGRLTRLVSIAKGLARVSAGSVRVVVAGLTSWHRPDRFVASFYTVCRGAGFIAAAFGSVFKEYSRPSYK